MRWAKASNYQAINLLLSTLLVVAAGSVMSWAHSSPLRAEFWFEAMVLFPQLEMVVALTRDGNTSLASRSLRTPLALWLGKISASLYLIHVPVYEYVVWALVGQLPPTNYRAQPEWTVLVYLAVSIAAAAVLFYGFEGPMRRSLRSKRNRPTSSPLHSSKVVATAPLATIIELETKVGIVPPPMPFEARAA